MPAQAAAVLLPAFTGSSSESPARIEQPEQTQHRLQASVDMRRLVEADPSYPAVLRAWASQLVSLDAIRPRRRGR